MKHLSTICVMGLLTFVMGVFASATAQGKPAANQPALASVLDGQITSLERQFIAAAEALPEDKFDYSPASLDLPGSEFKSVRTFSQQIKHVAADNFAIWAPLTGKPEPAGLNAPNGPENLRTRAEILKFLNDSFAFGHKAVSGMNANNELELVEFRGNKVTRIYLAIFAMTHGYDHYGQLVEYLRMNGIVPPASRPR